MSSTPGVTAALPTGVVTMLFTDIEGSSRIIDQAGPARMMRDA